MGLALLELEDEPQAESTATRLHYEAYNLAFLRLGREVAIARHTWDMAYLAGTEINPEKETGKEHDAWMEYEQLVRELAKHTMLQPTWAVRRFKLGSTFYPLALENRVEDLVQEIKRLVKKQGRLEAELAELKGAKAEPVRMFPSEKPDAHLDIQSKTMPKPTSITPPNGRTPPIKGEKRPGVPLEEIQEATAERLDKPVKYRIQAIRYFTRVPHAWNMWLVCGHKKRIHSKKGRTIGSRVRCYECAGKLPVRAGRWYTTKARDR